MTRRLMPGEASEDHQLSFKEKMVRDHGEYILEDDRWFFQDGTIMHRDGRIEEPLEQYHRVENIVHYLQLKLAVWEYAYQMFRAGVQSMIEGKSLEDEVDEWVTANKVNPFDMSPEQIECVLKQCKTLIGRTQRRIARLSDSLESIPMPDDTFVQGSRHFKAELGSHGESGEVIEDPNTYKVDPLVDAKTSKKLKGLLKKYRVKTSERKPAEKKKVQPMLSSGNAYEALL